MRRTEFLPLIFIIVLSLATTGFAGETIHPRNKVIMKMYPRKEALYYPQVPRVTAQEAFTLFLSSKAIFIHVGVEGGNFPGVIHLTEKQTWNLSAKKLASFSKGKFIVVYCD